jgi:hypothetical protein
MRLLYDHGCAGNQPDRLRREPDKERRLSLIERFATKSLMSFELQSVAFHRAEPVNRFSQGCLRWQVHQQQPRASSSSIALRDRHCRPTKSTAMFNEVSIAGTHRIASL